MSAKIAGRLVASLVIATLTVWLADRTDRCVPYSGCEVPPAAVRLG